MNLSSTGVKENSKEWWAQRYEASAGYLYSKEPSRFLMSYLDLLPAGAKVLEIACGEGRNAVALALKGYHVTGIDFCQTALDRAQRLADESKVKMNLKLQDLDFFIPELLSFDAIVSVNFKPALTLMKNLSRGLKQGGHLFLEAPLMALAKRDKSVEAFECFKPNELLTSLNPQSMQLQVLLYSELNADFWGENASMICRKTQLF
jgi:SAM-dependent methyltransferase